MRSPFLFFAIFFAVLFVSAGPARAQSNAAYPFAPWKQRKYDVLQSFTGAAKAPLADSGEEKRRRSAPDMPVLTPDDTKAIIEQLETATIKPAPSALERAYSGRIVDELEQFGYDLFGVPETGDKKEKRETDENTDSRPFALPAGAVQDNFILNIGDSLEITFRGQRKDHGVYAITNDGLLMLEDIPPVTAAGRSIGEVRQTMKAHAAALHNTDVYVSLAGVRQANILVVGHVKRPGRKTLTVFHTILDALMESGGIEKTGSLRQIKLIRDGRSTIIDLYGLLIHGSDNMDLALKDGDRLIVPPIGPTVAVTGNVKRPGIYESLPIMQGMKHKPQHTSEELTLNEMLELAGGILSPGQNRFIRLGLSAQGHENVTEIGDAYTPAFADGSILMVAPSDEKRAGMVELAGHTRRPGLHALGKTPTLSRLLSDSKVFGPDIYPLIGIIERWDNGQMAQEMITFPPLLVLKKQFDRKLQDGDVVHLFSRSQIIGLQEGQNKDGATLLQVAMGSYDGEQENDEEIDDPVIASVLREHAAFIRGAVRREGAWPVAEGTTLDSLIAVSGGLTLEASTSNIEVTSNLSGEGSQINGRSGTRRTKIDYRETHPSTVEIAPGDAVRVNQSFRKVEENSVLLIGEVSHPGRYDLLPGDRLSDLFRRAGGLTRQAYPDGAIFSRESERCAEEARFRAQARDLEVKLAAALKQDEETAPEKIEAVQAVIDELKQAEAVGRITVEANPGVLAVKPALDILLESGDRIYIPKRPLTVRVSGEVLSPASLQFRDEKTPRAYIAEAGGFTYHADDDRVFVLYPDGSAQPLQVSTWNHSATFIPPGSTIVVPRDPKPFDFIETARDFSQILSNLAITGIFLDDIHDN